MSHLDQSFLADIISGNVCNYYYKHYFTLYFMQDDATTKQTSYILQFLWRNLKSSLDILNSYYTCMGCLWNQLHLGPSLVSQA